MADFAGALDLGISDAAWPSTKRYVVPVGASAPGTRILPPDIVDTGVLAEITHLSDVHEETLEGDRSTDIVDYEGVLDKGPHEHWFEHLLAFPSSIALGNMLSTVVRDLEIYSSYRTISVTLDTAINNAGAGVSFTDLPGLPAALGLNSGVQFQVEVTMQGPSLIDGTLDFELSISDVSVLITGARVVMLVYEPEAPILEVMEFLTSIIEATDGTETRLSMRKNPRQLYQLTYRMKEGFLRRQFMSLIYDWQAQVFGIPVWFEARILDADVSIGSLTATVDTRYGDFRIDGLCILWTSEGIHEALEIESFTDSEITFSSETTVEHTGGVTLVMPLRLGITEEAVKVSRRAVNMDEFVMSVRVTDNDANLADTTPFDSHNSKVMIDEPNLMTGDTVPFNMLRKHERLDNQVGSPIQFSDWEASHIAHQKGFLSNTPQRMWEVRRLMHALRGSQVSFYLPTYYEDMVLQQPLVDTQVVMDIEAIGYADYIKMEEPLKSLRIEMVDGTILTRQVIGYAVIDDDTERLTVDVAWPDNYAINEVLRISFLMLVRLQNDRIEFNHARPGVGTVVTKVTGVPQ